MREQVAALVQRHLPGALRQSGGGNALTKCPFHKGGQETKPSFSVNLDKGLFHCFTCHVAGDVRYMLRLLGLPRSTIDAETAIIRPFLDKNRELSQLEKERFFFQRDPFKADFVLPESLLGVYDWCPQKLVQAGFSPQLLQDMEVGFDRLNNRITFPLRDMYGNLAGISGGAMTKQQMPKYKVYQGGRRTWTGQWQTGDYGEGFDERYPDYRCENHDFLWNFERVFPRLEMEAMSGRPVTVYVVEGFKACLWMIQNGFINTVALMGSYISERQQRMLHRIGGTVVLFLDNDKAGRDATLKIADMLWRPMYGRIRVVPYPRDDFDTQPDDYPNECVVPMVQSNISYFDHINILRRST